MHQLTVEESSTEQIYCIITVRYGSLSCHGRQPRADPLHHHRERRVACRLVPEEAPTPATSRRVDWLSDLTTATTVDCPPGSVLAYPAALGVGDRPVADAEASPRSSRAVTDPARTFIAGKPAQVGSAGKAFSHVERVVPSNLQLPGTMPPWDVVVGLKGFPEVAGVEPTGAGFAGNGGSNFSKSLPETAPM